MRILAAMLLLVSLCGCSTVYTVSQHNARVGTAKTVLAVAPEANGARLGVDLFALAASDTGYFAAWREDWKSMLAAHIFDAAVIAGSRYAYTELKDAQDSTRTDPPLSPAAIDSSTVYINYSGQQTIYSGNTRTE